jgi:hypothetical protein
MNGKRKRKEHLLILLLALLGLSIAANFLPEHLVSPIPPPSAKIQTLEPEEPDVLPALNRLNGQPARFKQVHRNIFDFSNQDSAQTQMEATPTGDDTGMLMPAGTAPGGPSLPEIRYVGYYREKAPSTVRLASLVLEGRIYVAAVGDVVSNEFKLLKISKDHVIVQVVSDSRTFRLPLGKNATPIPLTK